MIDFPSSIGFFGDASRNLAWEKGDDLLLLHYSTVVTVYCSMYGISSSWSAMEADRYSH